MFIVLAFNTPAFAKKDKATDTAAPKSPIIQVDLLSITLAVGTSGETKTYKITAKTTVQIDGAAGAVGDLKGGMLASVKVNPDGVTVASITATDPKAGKKKH
jgi:hypothetical protein